jgi:hypothetical protein
VKVTLLLADAAQAVNGKLYVLGGGWSITGPQPTPSAMAVKVEVPWDRANLKHLWQLELLDSDGQPVELPGPPEGELQPLRLQGEFEAGRPAGLKPGTPLDVALALNFGPLPIPPGGRYIWRFAIEGFDEDWHVGFSTRPAAETPTAPPPPHSL